LGTLHALAGHPADAMPLLNVAARQNPTNVRYWSNLGKASMEAKAWREAQEAITKALTLAPDDLDTLRTASSLAWRTQNFPAASDYFKKLQRLEPNQPEHARWLREAEARLSVGIKSNESSAR
jgi:Flp pilus assembly protein TadD